MTYTDREKLRCVERELKRRNQFFPGRIEAGKMTRPQASREILVMEEIAADYVAKIQADERARARAEIMADAKTAERY